MASFTPVGVADGNFGTGESVIVGYWTSTDRKYTITQQFDAEVARAHKMLAPLSWHGQ